MKPSTPAAALTSATIRAIDAGEPAHTVDLTPYKLDVLRRYHAGVKLVLTRRMVWYMALDRCLAAEIEKREDRGRRRKSRKKEGVGDDNAIG